MNRAITCVLTATAVAAGTAIAFAGSAQADAALNGKYAAVGGSDQFYVTVVSNCATAGCTANLVSNKGWTSVATMQNGTWTFDVVKPQGAICADGNFADIVIRYAVDANTLAGTVTADSNGECPGGQITQAPIQLTKVG
ncbi:MAG: hypothetical protein ACOYB7_03770 [Mycobacterium sp.]